MPIITRLDWLCCELLSIGKQTNTASKNSSSTSATLSTPKSTLNYEEFKKRKRLSRTNQMLSDKKKKTQEAATVQVGVFEAADGKLKRLKGRTLPLLVQTSSNTDDLLNAAVEKHSKHFKQFSKHAEYVLLYPDTSQVCKLPGSLQDFSLSEYKKDLGKAYSKICFYLCSKTDFEMVAEVVDTDTDGDELVPQLEIKDAVKIRENDQHEKKTAEAMCPSCFMKFPIDVIDTHANFCIDNRFDPIGDVSDALLINMMLILPKNALMEMQKLRACLTMIKGKR